MGDLLDPPGRGAEEERLADPRLEHHLLVELADAGVPLLAAGEEDAVEAAVGDRAAVHDRDAPARPRGPSAGRGRGPRSRAGAARRTRPTGSARRACRARPRTRGRESSANGAAPPHDRDRARPRPSRRATPSRRSAGRGRRAGCAGSASTRPRPSCIASVTRGAGEEVAAVLREDHAAARRVDPVPGAADALHAARDRGRRLDLHDEVDGAHVDAELERATSRRGRAGVPAFSASSIATRCGRAMEPWWACTSSSPASSLSAAASRSARRRLFTKIERRAVRPDELEEARVDRRPDRRPDRCLARVAARGLERFAEPRHVLDRHLDGQLERLPRARVDDRDRTVARRLAGAGRLLGGAPDRERRPGSARPRRAGAASRTGRCAGAGGPRGPRAARATARGARRAWSGRARGSRRR